MTTWDIRTRERGKSKWEHLQVQGSTGLPVWNQHVEAVIQEDGSLCLVAVATAVDRIVIDAHDRGE